MFQHQEASAAPAPVIQPTDTPAGVEKNPADSPEEAATPAAPPAKPASDAENPPADPANPIAPPAKSATRAFLDTLTDGADRQKPNVDTGQRAGKKLSGTLAGQTHPANTKAAAAAQPAAHDPQNSTSAPQKQQDSSAEPTDDEMMAELSERGQKRFRGLIHSLREREDLLRDREERISSVQQLFRQSGASADQLQGAIDLIGLSNSGDPVKLRQALAMLDQHRASIAQVLGEPAPGKQAYQQFADLQQLVDGLHMEPSTAESIAKERLRAQAAEQLLHARTQKEQQQQQQQQQHSQRMQATQRAAAQIDQWLQSRGNSVDHSARVAHIQQLLGDPARLQQFANTYEPHQWLSAIQMLYESVKVERPKSPAVQPLTSRITSGALNPVPAGAQGQTPASKALASLGL